MSQATELLSDELFGALTSKLAARLGTLLSPSDYSAIVPLMLESFRAIESHLSSKRVGEAVEVDYVEARKAVVSMAMDKARHFRAAVASDYDVFYKELETFLYGVVAPQPSTKQDMCVKHPRYSTYPFCPDCRHEEEKVLQDMELPPLPDSHELYFHEDDNVRICGYTAEQMQAYARQEIEQAQAGNSVFISGTQSFTIPHDDSLPVLFTESETIISKPVNLPGKCTLHAQYQLTNPKKLIGYDVLNESRKLVGVVMPEDMPAQVLGGEYICTTCGLRQHSDNAEPNF